jgi:spore coat protein H
MTSAIARSLAGVMLGTCAVGVSAQNDTDSRNASPDYARVFNQDRVGRIELRIAASDWQAVIADMEEMAGPSGGQFGGGNPPGGGAGGPGGGIPPSSADAVAACTGRIEGDACSFGTPSVTGRCTQTPNGGPLACIALGGAPGGGGGPGGGGAGGGGNVGGPGRDDVELLPRNPIYVPAEVTFDGETFRHVGFRLKGNSSLVNTWRSGSEKLPFRLNIDGLEARFPEIRDQTFFGFPNLSFSNNSLDSSYLRAKVVTDLFREAGLPAPRTAFIQVYLDRGSGSSYLGLYTMVEVPDDPFLELMFGSDEGNLYKPHSTGGRWTVFDQNDFPKRTNEFDEDWTDIQGAIAALNASKLDRASWRQRLEARFDVNGFLRWLALNTIVANTDAYGGLSAHNYYLYGSPRHRDRLFWIPWDHDLAMSTGGLGGGAAGGPGGGAAGGNVDLFHAGINASWPLIRFFMDDPVYRATYRAHVENLLGTVFEPSRLSARFQSEHARIAPFVIGASGELPGRSFAGTPAEFDATVFGPTGLIAYVESRAAAVRRALGAAQ